MDTNENDEQEGGRASNGGTEQRCGSSGYHVLAVIVAIFALPLFSLGAVAWYATRLVDGELVLTRTGCQVLEYHGATVEYLEDGSLCALRTKFRIGIQQRAGRVLVQSEHGAFEVELSGKEVVSTSYR